MDIKPFIGKANIFVNVKFDDPETLQQMPGLQDLLTRYGPAGLHVLAFPTDQGWFEADDSNTLRLKFKQVYNFGQYPSAMVCCGRPGVLCSLRPRARGCGAQVFDKYDLLGGKALPLYSWMTNKLPNQWGAPSVWEKSGLRGRLAVLSTSGSPGTHSLACRAGVRRIVFDYERFLVDESGQPLRRYPRKYPVERMEARPRVEKAGI